MDMAATFTDNGTGRPINHKLPCQAMFFAIASALVLAVIASASLMLAWAAKQAHLELENRQTAIWGLNSSIECLSDQACDNDMLEEIWKDRLPGFSSSFREWGAWDILMVSYTGKETYSTAALVGYSPGESGMALHLPENDLWLYMAGEAEISGRCLLPAAGAKPIQIGRYKKPEAVNIKGDINKSGYLLPAPNCRTRNIASTLDSLKALAWQQLPRQLNVSFADSSYIAGGIDIRIEGNCLTGNIAIIAQRSIYVCASSKIEHAILYAPRIEIASGFSGNLQAFATDSLIIREGAKLNYPSVCGLIGNAQAPVLRIEPGAKIYGGILASTEQYAPLVFLDTNAEIYGVLYNGGSTILSGTVYGTVYTGKLTVHTPQTIYDNAIADGKIFGQGLPSEFALPLIANTGEKKIIAAWLY